MALSINFNNQPVVLLSGRGSFYLEVSSIRYLKPCFCIKTLFLSLNKACIIILDFFHSLKFSATFQICSFSQQTPSSGVKLNLPPHILWPQNIFSLKFSETLRVASCVRFLGKITGKTCTLTRNVLVFPNKLGDVRILMERFPFI